MCKQGEAIGIAQHRHFVKEIFSGEGYFLTCSRIYTTRSEPETDAQNTIVHPTPTPVAKSKIKK